MMIRAITVRIGSRSAVDGLPYDVAIVGYGKRQ